MVDNLRKPPATLPSRESGKPHSIRFTDSAWDEFFDAAKRRGIGVTEYVRLASIAGHGYLAAQDAMGKYTRAAS